VKAESRLTERCAFDYDNSGEGDSNDNSGEGDSNDNSGKRDSNDNSDEGDSTAPFFFAVCLKQLFTVT
jgi:hypothetical protein